MMFSILALLGWLLSDKSDLFPSYDSLNDESSSTDSSTSSYVLSSYGDCYGPKWN